MNDKPTRPVSVRKAGVDDAAASGAAVKAPPPRPVVYAVAAMIASGVFAVVAAVMLFGEKNWLFHQARNSNPDKGKKGYKTVPQLHSAVDKTVTSQVVATVVVLVVLTVLAIAVYRGRHWSRWGVIGVWVLSTFTSTIVGFASVILIGSSEPVAFKVPAFISGVAFVAAVILVTLKPSTQFFALSKPDRGNAPARRGLFAPRTPPPSRADGRSAGGPATGGRPARMRPRTAAATTPAQTRPANDRGTERSRAKQRASSDAVAKGAELARARAKASKSRRSAT